jgi:GrpB-like predicted nucleotidyltransferase (UPF0157 family)
MTITIWYRQNHANSSSSDKSPLHAWRLGDTKKFRGELEQDFCEKMSTFGALATQNIPRRMRMSCSRFWQPMKENEDYSKSGMFSRQIIPDWNMHQGSNQREVLILPRWIFWQPMKAEDYSKVEQSMDRPFHSGISIRGAIERSSGFTVLDCGSP